MYELFLGKKIWNSGLNEDILKMVVMIFIDILVKKKKIQFSFLNIVLSFFVNQRCRSVI